MLTKEQIEKLKGRAPKTPWACYDGFGHSDGSGLCSCAALGSEERTDQITTSIGRRADLMAPMETFELACHAVNNLDALCDLALRGLEAKVSIEKSQIDGARWAFDCVNERQHRLGICVWDAKSCAADVVAGLKAEREGAKGLTDEDIDGSPDQMVECGSCGMAILRGHKCHNPSCPACKGSGVGK